MTKNNKRIETRGELLNSLLEEKRISETFYMANVELRKDIKALKEEIVTLKIDIEDSIEYADTLEDKLIGISSDYNIEIDVEDLIIDNFKGVYIMIGNHKTSVINDNNVLIVAYHNTPVVKVTDTEIILNTGGWYSATTKRRMNQASLSYGLGFAVSQVNFSWYVDYKGEVIPFEDNMKLKK